MKTKLHRWKAYNSLGESRVFKNKGNAKKFAGDEGTIVDLLKGYT